MPENITSVAAIAGAVGAFVAAIVISLSNVVVTLINKKAEERKHYRELIINAAIENYKEERSMANSNGKEARNKSNSADAQLACLSCENCLYRRFVRAADAQR
jgi:hypothetical protein